MHLPDRDSRRSQIREPLLASDFEANGPYHALVIGMFGLYLWRVGRLIRPAILVPVVLGAFALSTISFAYYAVYKPIPVSHFR